MESIHPFNCNPRQPQNSLRNGFLHLVSICCNVCGHEAAKALSNPSASESTPALVTKKTQGAFHTSRLFLVAPSCVMTVPVVTDKGSADPQITFIKTFPVRPVTSFHRPCMKLKFCHLSDLLKSGQKGPEILERKRTRMNCMTA